MLTFETNLSHSNLLLGSNIFFNEKNKVENKIELKTPTIKDNVEDTEFGLFLSLISLDIQDFEKMNLGFKVEKIGQGIIGVLRLDFNKGFFKKYFEKYILNSTVDSVGIKVNERYLTAEEVEYAAKILLISCGVKDIGEIEFKKETDETEGMSPSELRLHKKQKEILEKLKKAKEKKNKNNIEITAEKVIVGVMREFNMSIEDIKNLNYFSLYWLFGYVFKIDHYAFMQMAAANGNLDKKSKLEHWLK